jgi:uncharacterized protein (TIGR03437 family)
MIRSDLRLGGCLLVVFSTMNAATTLTATASGAFGSDGANNPNGNPAFQNYSVGWDPADFSVGVLLRNFFIFNLSGVSGTIVSATLNLYVPKQPPDSCSGYLSFEPSERYQITGTTTSVPDLTTIYPAGSAKGQEIFQTIGTGTLFGTTTVSPANEGSSIQLTLNAEGLTYLNANEGNLIALTGQDPDAPSSGPTSSDCATCRFFFTCTDPTNSGVFKQTPRPTLVLNLAPTPTITSVISAGGFGGFSAVAPGTWMEIYGSNLAPDTRSWAGSDFNGNNAPTALDGVGVTIGGQKAFVDYISSSPGQINAQVPSNVPTGGTQELTVTNGTVTSAPFNVTVNSTEPGLLAPSAFQIGGKQYVVALLPDGGTYILPTGAIAGVASRPAHPGETITLYGIGFGGVTPSTPAGQIETQTNQLSAPLQILFGQTAAQINYDGLAPGFVGLYQFNVVVPAVPDSDLVPLTFNLGGAAGSQTLYTAVHQ